MKQHLNLIKLPLFFLLMLLLLCPGAYAQKAKKVHGKATITISENDNITPLEAKQQCINLARENAIKEEFGEVISSITNMSDAIINGEDVSQFISETNLMSKAEWIEDTKEPKVDLEIIDGKITYTAEVWGRAKEVKASTIELDWKILAGGLDDTCESHDFKNKQRIYIKFTSPIDGYLAIYLLDNIRKEASCLLPYKNNKRGQHYVQGGKEYYLFDPDSDPKAFRYRMSTNVPREIDRVVLIFSPNPFTKCNEITGDRLHPNSLSIDDFKAWLRRLQSRDDELVVDQTRCITITQ